MPLAKAGHDIVVIDDGSSDDSADIARSYGAVVLTLPFRMGAWCATQTGLQYGASNGYATVICMDGDAQHPAKYIQQLCSAMQWANADVVVASHPDRGGASRQYVRQFLSALSGAGVTDLTSGFRLINRRAIKILCREEMTLVDYQDVGPLCLLRQQGMRVVETSAVFVPRRQGRSRVFGCFSSVVDYIAQSFLLACCFAVSRCLRR